MIKLEEKNIDRAAEMFTRSFWKDPFLVYLAPDEKQRVKLGSDFFKFMLRYTIMYGEAYTTSQNFEGAALWLPSQYASITPALAAKAGKEELERSVGDDFMARLNLVNGYADEKHTTHISAPHWYLAYIGIDPDFQGKGFGSKLINPMLERFSADWLPCYLETSTKINVSLYEHFGFRLIEEYIVPQTRLTFYAMLRK